MSQFQLFPSSSPAKGSNNPFRTGMKKSIVKADSGSPIPLDEVKDPTKAESVALQIRGDTKADSSAASAEPVARTKTPETTGASHSSASPRSQRTRSPQVDKPKRKISPLQRSASNSSSSSFMANLAASPQSSRASASPVPMRSMFPQFDPKLPVDKQNYHLHIPNGARPAKSRKPQLTLSPTPKIDDALGPKTVPASVLNFPSGALGSDETRYSSPQELETLWEASNGQRPQNLSGIFNIRMTRTGPATFVFGDFQQPFYTLETYLNDELCISRGAPSNPNSNIPIMDLSLEERSRRDHPNDGLVALLFSRLAAMLAIEEAEEISKERHLVGSEAAEIENKALCRAAAQESCRLSWNRNLRLYELWHPSKSKQQPGAVGVSLSSVQYQPSGILHIAVSTPSSDASPQQPLTIIATNPVSSRVMEAAQQAATARTSTLPVTDADEPLAALDLATRTLSISPGAVIATIPSLYAIDSLVAAMLAVAVSDEATNPILADMEVGSPQSESCTTSKQNILMPFRGQLITTLAEREDYAESMQLASQMHPTNSKSGTAPAKNGFFRFWSRRRAVQGRPRSTKKKQHIVVEEFDLEKYGRYGHGSSREGEKLPGVVRGILRILFFGLNMLVKGLTVIAKVLAWLLVNSTRCLTSEKF